MKNLLEKVLESANVTINGSQPWDVQIHDERIFNNVLINPSLAIGEGYMEGWWSCAQLDELFFRILRRTEFNEGYRNWRIFWARLLNIIFNQQSRQRSLTVAKQHYNLDNTLFEHMLGKSMAYSCGYWANASTLDEAQFNKFDLICRKLDLQSKDKVLELGCGWGTFANFAAEKYGCEMVSVNISSEQIKYANENKNNLPITFYQCDYRDAETYNPQKIKFDKVVSIGLCEHIGFKNYRTFMQVARANLKEDGLFLFQTIGRNDSANFADPWMVKYMFPGGLIPSIKQLSGSMENIFALEDLHCFGADYYKTLMAWKDNFDKHWQTLSTHYDEKFYRMWTYYLLSCAGACRARDLQLWQWVLSPRGVIGGYKSIR